MHSTVVALGSIITEGKAVRGNRFRSCPSVDHQQRRRTWRHLTKTISCLLYLLLIIYSTHTHTHTFAETHVCVRRQLSSLAEMSLPIYQNEKVANRLAPRCAVTAWVRPQEGGRGGARKSSAQEQCMAPAVLPFPCATSKMFQQLPVTIVHCGWPFCQCFACSRFVSKCWTLRSVCLCVCVGECVCSGACWSRQMFKFAALLPVCISSGQMSAPWQKRKGNGCRHWHTFIWTWAQVEQTQ